MLQVSVIGPSHPEKDLYKLAYKVGETLAVHGVILITGGRGGIMEAASCGVKENGGITVGILPGNSSEANKCVDIKIPTHMNELRNFLVVASGDIIISFGISDGTLIELSIAKKLKKTVMAFHLPSSYTHLATYNFNATKLSAFEKHLLQYVERNRH